MQMIIFFYGCGVGGAYPVVGAETSSVKLRAKSQSIGFLVNAFFSWLFNFTVPYMFDADQGNLGGKCGFVFFALCVIGVTVIFFEIPEMKNRTYAELNTLFESRVPTRKFGKDVLNSHDV
jgi:MFS transporter, SP family, general alpha glucoside:H+ symporter